MRIQLEATPEELRERGDDLVRELAKALTPAAPDLAEHLEAGLPQRPPGDLRHKAMRQLKAKTEKAYKKQLKAMVGDILKVLDGGERVHKSEGGLDPT